MKLFLIFSLYKSHIRSSKKVLAFSCIGLIVALTLVSSSLYFLDNSKQEVLDNYLHDKSTGNDIQLNIKQDYVFNATPSIEAINSSIHNVTSSYHFDFINKSATEIIRGIGNFKLLGSDFMINNQSDYVSANIFQMTPVIQSELQKIHLDQYGTNLTFPSENELNKSFIQAYILFNGFNWFSTKEAPVPEFKTGPMDLYVVTTCMYYLCEIPYKINLTHYEVLEPTFYTPFQDVNRADPQTDSQAQFRYPNLYALSLMSTSPGFLIFVTNITQVSTLLQPWIDIHFLHPDLGYNTFQNFFIVKLAFDYSKLNFETISNFLNKQKLFGGTLISDISLKGFPVISVLYHSSGLIQYVYSQIEILTNQIIFIDLPSLLIALLLTHYVFSLIYKNIIRNISIYKVRGASGWFIFIFQILDVFVILILSILISLILGVPLSVFSLKSDNLLSFNHSLPDFFIFNFEMITVILIYTAIALEFIVNTNRIRKLSKISVAETDNPQESSATSEPTWKQHFVDFGLIIYSISTYLIYNYITTDPGISQSINSVLPIINNLMIPSPFIFVIGCILLLSRFIPLILNKLSSFLWTHTGNLTALSFKNIIRYKNTTLRAILIIACVVGFLTFFYSQPYSMLESYKQTLYYQSGADGVAVFKGNHIEPSVINELMSNKAYSQYIDSICSYVYLIGTSDTNEQINFLLVNTSTYLNTSYLNYNLGLNNTLTNDMKAITLTDFADFSQTTAINILLDQNTLNQRKAEIGANISLIGKSSQRFTVIDSFSSWPYLLPYASNINQGSLQFNAIGDINYFLKDLHGHVSNSIFSGLVEGGLFIKFKDLSSAELTNITSKIEQNTPLVFKSVPILEYENNKENFAFLAIGEVNLNVLISLAIVIIVILLFIQLQLIERRREMYTERAMGMKPLQLAYMFYVENVVILIFSLLIGTIIGIYFIQLITIFTFNTILINPFNVVFIPINTLLVTDLIILVLSLIFSLIPTNTLLKQNISNSFIGEV